MNYHKCTGPCGETKEETTEFFYKNANVKRGFTSECKVCVRARSRAYLKLHKDDAAERKRAYNKSHKEEIDAYNKKYGESHKEEIAIRNKKYRDSHKEEIAARDRVYKKSHKEQRAAYREEHKEEIAAQAKAYKERPVNKERIRINRVQYDRKKRLSNPQFKSATRIRHATGDVVVKNLEKGKSVDLLGGTSEFVRSYLESKFHVHPDTGIEMDFKNRGKGEGKWNIDHIKSLNSFDLTDKNQYAVAGHWTNIQPLWHCEHLEKHKNEKYGNSYTYDGRHKVLKNDE